MLVWTRKLLYRFNRLVVPLDRPFMADPARGHPPLFILGPPRSGTTLTYQTVTQQFHFAYMTKMMNYFYGIPNLTMRAILPCIRRPSPVFISEYGVTPGWCVPAESGNFWFRWFPRNGHQGHYVDPERTLADRYISLKKNVYSLSAIAGAPMIFKCVYLSMAAGVLAQIFPDARFICVRRDMLLSSYSILRRRMLQKNPSDWWSVKPPHYEHLRMAPIWQQAVEQVFYADKILNKDLQRFAPNRYFEISYRDLCENPLDIITKLRDWLAPWGDFYFSDQRIPDSFSVSPGAKVPEDMADKMGEHLQKLFVQDRGDA